MSFFNSEVVRAELTKIQELQDSVYINIFTFTAMSKEKKLKHVEMLEELLDKQKILYTRLSLSDDPEAKEMKAEIVFLKEQLEYKTLGKPNYDKDFLSS